MQSRSRSSLPPKSHLLVLAIFYTFLLVPIGQLDYLYQHWMIIGVFGTAFLLIGALPFRNSSISPFRDLQFLTLLLLVAYLFHEFEEHGIDLLGRHYYFMVDANAMMRQFSGCTTTDCPLNPYNIYYINILLVWCPLSASIIFAGRRFWFAQTSAASLLLVNGITHIGTGILRLSYNPGLLTALVLFVPLSLYYYKEISRHYHLDKMHIWLGFAYGVVTHIVLAVAIVLVYGRHLIPESMFQVSFILTAAFPFVIGLLRKDSGVESQISASGQQG